VRLLMLTGARRQELGSLTWSEIDFAARVINLPASRVKNKEPHQIPLSQIAFDILAARQQDFLTGIPMPMRAMPVATDLRTSCSRNHQSGTFAGIVGLYQHHDSDTPSPRQVGHSPIDNRWTGEGCGSGVGLDADQCSSLASRLTGPRSLPGSFLLWCSPDLRHRRLGLGTTGPPPLDASAPSRARSRNFEQCSNQLRARGLSRQCVKIGARRPLISLGFRPGPRGPPTNVNATVEGVRMLRRTPAGPCRPPAA
jgi:hypothetical protein